MHGYIILKLLTMKKTLFSTKAPNTHTEYSEPLSIRISMSWVILFWKNENELKINYCAFFWSASISECFHWETDKCVCTERVVLNWILRECLGDGFLWQSSVFVWKGYRLTLTEWAMSFSESVYCSEGQNSVHSFWVLLKCCKFVFVWKLYAQHLFLSKVWELM